MAVNEDGAVCVGGGTFSFPHSVVKGSDQALAFEALASRLLERAREGYNCTIMAYGQTGSGKTHTMFGPPGSLTEAAVDAAAAGGGAVPETWGLFPRAVLHVMREGETAAAVQASAVEIYHEGVFDLMDNRNPLQVGRREVGLKVGGVADRPHGGRGGGQGGGHRHQQVAHRARPRHQAARRPEGDARLVPGLDADHAAPRLLRRRQLHERRRQRGERGRARGGDALRPAVRGAHGRGAQRAARRRRRHAGPVREVRRGARRRPRGAAQAHLGGVKEREGERRPQMLSESDILHVPKLLPWFSIEWNLF